MPDFPLRGVPPLHIHSGTRWCVGPELRNAMGAGAPAAVTWVANTACYIPLSIPWPYPVKRVFWVNGSTITSTSCDFGIYTFSGKLIYSTASQTASGASLPQYITPSTPFVLDAGAYMMAWACNNTTSRAFGWAPTAVQGAASGCLSQTSAFALPASATFATYGAPCIPLCGITRTASGF